MTPNLTVGYMAEQINRGRLDSVAARGWLTEELAATHSRAIEIALANLGAALVRLGERMQRNARPVGPSVDPTALAAR